jgi:hypothetical protein
MVGDVEVESAPGLTEIWMSKTIRGLWSFGWDEFQEQLENAYDYSLLEASFEANPVTDPLLPLEVD